MKKTLKDIDFKGKTVLVRVDFNVPLKDGVISDDARIVAAMDTINYLVDHEAKIVLCSHLGKINHKDKDQEEADKKKNDMAIVANRLSEIMDKDIYFSDDVVSDEVSTNILSLNEKDILLLQNTRYEIGEEKNDPELSEKLAKNIDVFVLDAFGSAHRKHASTYGVVEVLKSKGRETCIGFLMEKEIMMLERCIEGNINPYVAVLGGAKVSDKIKVIDGLLQKADKIIVGGAMAYTFLKALGHDIGKSKVEEDKLEYAKKCYEDANGKIILPIDHIVARNPESLSSITLSIDENIPDDYMGLDIGSKTVELFKKELEGAKMVFWNGPLGLFENKYFAKGTEEIANKIVSLENCFSVVGGGDSASFCKAYNIVDKFSHVSTGGGASLEMIEEGHLVCVDVIENVGRG